MGSPFQPTSVGAKKARRICVLRAFSLSLIRRVTLALMDNNGHVYGYQTGAKCSLLSIGHLLSRSRLCQKKCPSRIPTKRIITYPNALRL